MTIKLSEYYCEDRDFISALICPRLIKLGRSVIKDPTPAAISTGFLLFIDKKTRIAKAIRITMPNPTVIFCKFFLFVCNSSKDR